MASRAQRPVSSTVADRMGQRMPYRHAPAKSQTVVLACARLAFLHGDSAKSWKNRFFGAASDFTRCAQILTVLREMGMHDLACRLAAPIEAVMAGEPCAESKHREAFSDAHEDVLQAEQDHNPCEKNLRALLRYRAVMRQASLDDDRRRVAEAPAEWRITL